MKTIAKLILGFWLLWVYHLCMFINTTVPATFLTICSVSMPIGPSIFLVSTASP